MAPDDRRVTNLRAALRSLRLPPRAPELRLLHAWLDSWLELGLIVARVERLGLRLSLTHVADGEWRATFMGDPMFASRGFGVATTPWAATQLAAWAALRPPLR